MLPAAGRFGRSDAQMWVVRNKMLAMGAGRKRIDPRTSWGLRPGAAGQKGQPSAAKLTYHDPRGEIQPANRAESPAQVGTLN